MTLNLGRNANADIIIAESTFDTGLDGWTSNFPDQVSWEPLGGNPGGYFYFADATSGNARAFAPATFLGDWSPLDNTGKLYFDHRIIDPGPINFGFTYLVQILGPGGTARWIGPTSTGATPWTNFVVQINENNWQVQSGTWDELLNSVTEIGIRIELIDNSGGPADIDGLDNIRLTNVPEPSSLAFAMFGVAVVGIRRRRLPEERTRMRQ